MPCMRCANGKWKFGQRGRCVFDSQEHCRRAEAAMHIQERQARHVHLRVKPAELRTEQFDGREHLVVPVVMLVEGVVQGIASQVPELVLAEELAVAPAGWNGRPCVGNHPMRDGTPISANDPRVLERERFGTVFNTRMKGRRLVCEAWLDPGLAKEESAQAFALKKLQDGEAVEISVGAYVVLERSSGEYNGSTYGAIWREIVPDHLAFLGEGKTGACSIEMGCGALRANEIIDLSKEEKEEDIHVKEGEKDVGPLIPRSVFKPQQEGISYSELWRKLTDATRAVEPGFLWVEDVWTDDKSFVYVVQPTDTLETFRRTYEVNSNDEVSIAKKRDSVQFVGRWEPLEQGCGCQNREGDERVMTEKKDRVNALVASPHTSFTENDVLVLMQTPEPVLLTLERDEQAMRKAAEERAEAERLRIEEEKKNVQETPKEQTEEEFLRTAPESIRRIVVNAKKAEAERRKALITQLVADQKTYDEQALDSMSIEQLELTAALVAESKPQRTANVDYGSRGVPRETRNEEYVAPPPPSMYERLRAQKAH